MSVRLPLEYLRFNVLRTEEIICPRIGPHLLLSVSTSAAPICQYKTEKPNTVPHVQVRGCRLSWAGPKGRKRQPEYFAFWLGVESQKVKYKIVTKTLISLRDREVDLNRISEQERWKMRGKGAKELEQPDKEEHDLEQYCRHMRTHFPYLSWLIAFISCMFDE